jgi:peptidoglycan/xylan/chitin deacetylase (PgdA/CDA1 family)
MKKTITKILAFGHVDAISRSINRKRLLVLNYHGLIKSVSPINLFTQLPVELFEKQVRFLKSKYNVISLSEFISHLKGDKSLPDMAAMITFDDGFKSNYTLAFPLLKKYNLPATIFLTVDYIGTDKLLWFDELFLLIMQSVNSGIDIASLNHVLRLPTGISRDYSNLYPNIAKGLKKLSYEEIIDKISILRNAVGVCDDQVSENFKLLDWDNVIEMKKSGLIEFGVHTATHRILSKLSGQDFEDEIKRPKEGLSERLGDEVLSFAYPNGIPYVDFFKEHQDYLKNTGYLCAFSTGEWLNSAEANPFCIGRISVGNDITSNMDFFRLNTSGFNGALKKFLNHKS